MEFTWKHIAICLVLVAVFRLNKVGRRPPEFPPGPPTLPLLGNLHQIDPNKTHVQFQKWAAQYGPIFSLILGTKCMIVLSSPDVIKDLLDKRGSIYSSRADSHIISTATNELNLVMMEYGDNWRKCHKFLHKNLNARAVKAYIPYQDLENKQMLLGFLEEPELFNEHIRRYTNSLTTQLVFGFRTIDLFDPKLLQLYTAFDGWIKLTKNALSVLVDFYPPLRSLPDLLLPLRRTAKELYRSEHDLFLGHWNNIKSQDKNKTAKPCIAQDLIRAQETEGFSDDQASHLCGILLEAGSDTTGVELTAFVQAMVLFPEAQKQAQAEIDRVCGTRMPTMEDAPSLPYIRASVKEICRWMPAALTGIPHSVTCDDEYMGYKIPKGAMVAMNVWAIHMDPERHQDPRTFNPARYLSNCDKSARESSISSDPNDRDHFLFGAGRRSCPGIDLADNSLFMGLARLVWAFDFTVAHDEEGRELRPDPDDIVSGLPAHPAPFKAKITARSAERAADVKKAWTKAESELLDGEKQWREVPQNLKFDK